MKTKTPTSKRKAQKSDRQPRSAWERFQAAIKCVVRNLGGAKQFLLACGYIPSEWVKGCKPGFYVSPHNPKIMWKANDAIKDHFTRFRWHDRALEAERQFKPNV